MNCLGWVKIHRKLLESHVFANPDLLKIWVWCLLKANHGKEWVSIKTGRGKTEVEVNPGQFLFGRKSASKELKMVESTVWKRMNKLKNMGNCDIESNSHYSLISIINWDIYQCKDDVEVTPKGTGKEQPSNTNKNDKEKYSDKLKTFVGRYIKFISDTYPTKKPSGKNIESNSMKTVFQLTDIDGFEEEYVFNAIRWAQKNDFWKSQIYSLAGLRKKSPNGLTKFQNLSNAYDKDKPEEFKPKISVFKVVND